MENNEQRPVTAERLKDLINLHNIMATGDTSEYKPDELIKLSGIMAEAAAAFYFSEKANSQYTKNIVAAMYTEVMEAATQMIYEIGKKDFSKITDTESEEDCSTWTQCEDAYIEYIARTVFKTEA